jgi:hypothetical protein
MLGTFFFESWPSRVDISLASSLEFRFITFAANITITLSNHFNPSNRYKLSLCTHCERSQKRGTHGDQLSTAVRNAPDGIVLMDFDRGEAVDANAKLLD